MMNTQEKYVLAVDIGTTNIKAAIFDKAANIHGSSVRQIKYISPGAGREEIEPDALWTQFREVVIDAAKSASISFSSIGGLGLSSQRSSIITWDRETGEPFHNILSWKDTRAYEVAESWNHSWKWRAAAAGAGLLYYLSGGMEKWLAANIVRFDHRHGSIKILWLLENNEQMRERTAAGMTMFGTIDCWLLWKLTAGKKHIIDFASASSTGMFDPYTMDWAHSIMSILGIPSSLLLPNVVDNRGHICDVDEAIFGVSFPVSGSLPDQQASIFGQCCFRTGDITCSIGTGAFVDINTGSKTHTSCTGLYPLIAWKCADETMFTAEGYAGDAARVVDWAQGIGLYGDPKDTAKIAESVPDSGGACFVPCFTGFVTPIRDLTACTSIIGINSGTTKAHLVRAILEAIAFRIFQVFKVARKESPVPLRSTVAVCGGVSNNDIVMQTLANLLQMTVERAENPDMALVGVAFMAGLGAGIWKSKTELLHLKKPTRVYTPCPDKKEDTLKRFDLWSKAMSRTLKWSFREGNKLFFDPVGFRKVMEKEHICSTGKELEAKGAFEN